MGQRDNDAIRVLQAIGGTEPTPTTQGYVPSDTGPDGVVRYVGAGNDRDPVLVSHRWRCPNIGCVSSNCREKGRKAPRPSAPRKGTRLLVPLYFTAPLCHQVLDVVVDAGDRQRSGLQNTGLMQLVLMFQYQSWLDAHQATVVWRTSSSR
ncbi:MAG: hypothetical protein IPG92_13785 [Flavobacteriales bacterium]|nr:hypothetical protein [Flavobacteriales bacterium]